MTGVAGFIDSNIERHEITVINDFHTGNLENLEAVMRLEDMRINPLKSRSTLAESR